MSHSFFPKKIQWFTQKSYTSSNQPWIIHGNLMIKNQIYPAHTRVTLIWLSCIQNGMEVKEYDLEYMIFDLHFQDEADIVFQEIQFSLDGLFQFFWQWMFELQQTNNTWWSPLFNPDEISIKFAKNIQNTPFLEIDNFKFSFVNSVNKSQNDAQIRRQNNGSRLLESIEIKNHLHISISWKNKWISLQEIADYLTKFQRFFSLIFGEDVRINKLQVKYRRYYSEHEKSFLKTKKDSIDEEIHIIFNNYVFLRILWAKKNTRSSIKSLFTYDDVQDDFSKILEKYFDNSDKHKAIYNVYYATLQNQYLHIENQFLNMIQALEWMYWKSNIQVKIGNREYTISQMSEKMKDDNKNEEIFFLASKLKGIFTYLWISFEIESWKDIITTIKNTRNTLSHWWDRNISVDELYNMVELLRVALELFILKEVWINDNLYTTIREHKINVDLKCSVI